MAERALLGALGGTCHSPIAVLTRHEGEHLYMRAALFSADGAERVEGETRCPADDLSGPAGLARDLLTRATPGIAALFEGAA